MKSNRTKTWMVTGLLAACMAILAGCNGLLVNSQTDELTWLGRATLRAGNFTHNVGGTQPVLLDDAYLAGGLAGHTGTRHVTQTTTASPSALSIGEKQ